MDFYGNQFDAQGNYTGSDYYASQAWQDAKAANDALQAAVAEANAAEDSGVPEQQTAAKQSVDSALKAYVEASSAVPSNAGTTQESHIDAALEPGPKVYSEPAERTEYLNPSPFTPMAGAGGLQAQAAGVSNMSPVALIAVAALLFFIFK